MTPNLEIVLSIVAVGVAMLGVVAGVVRWVVSSAVASIREALDTHMESENATLSGIVGRIRRNELRIDDIDRRQSASPSKDDLHGLALALEKANGRLEAGVERFRAIEATVSRFDESVRDLNRSLSEEQDRARK